MIENNSLKVWCTAMKGPQFKAVKFIEEIFLKTL